MDKYTSTGELARKYGVTPASIRRWVTISGVPIKKTPGGRMLIPVSELKNIIKNKEELT